MKTYAEWSEKTQTVSIECEGEAGTTIKEMMDYIKSSAGIGHSFEIVVDPESKKRKKSFFIDGDGADRITSVELFEKQRRGNEKRRSN